MTSKFPDLEEATIAENFEAVFKAMPGNCVLLHVNPPFFTIINTTNGYAKLYGKEPSDLLKQDFFSNGKPSTINEKTELLLRSSFELVLKTKEEQELELDHQGFEKGNYLKHFDKQNIINTPVLNKQGEVIFIIHKVIHQQNQAKIEQADLAKQAYNLFLQAPTAICIIKGNNQVIELANQQILSIWRKEPGIIGKPLLEALPEIKGTQFPGLLADVRKTGKPYFENESHARFIRNGKEELVYFNFAYQPFYDDNSDEATGVLVIASEVTEQVLSRKKVEENEQRYRNLIAEAAVATAVYEGPEMKIRYANDAMMKLWGKEVPVLGKTVRQALPELDGQPFHELLDHVFKTGETYLGKEDKGEIIVNGTLQTFYFNFTFKALRNANDEIYGILNMAIDVTDQVLAQKALRENEANLQRKIEERTHELEIKNSNLERSNTELDQFAYVASHDLQEPLRKIRVFGDRLSRLIEDKPEVNMLIGKIHSSALRMAGLINSLLDYSRLSDNLYGFEPVDLNKIIKSVLTDFELLITQKKATVIFDSLPVIEAIPLQMNQLFFNLIGNALKFSKKDQPPVISVKAVLLSQEEKGSFEQLNQDLDYRAITVKDNGIGFNQEYASKIFTIFQRLNDKSIYGGYGIGLALCKKVADTHCGIVYAEGRPKEGAAFTIILPDKH